MTSSILADKISQLCAQAHIGNGGFVVAPFLNREAFEQDESLAIKYLGPNRAQQGRKLWDQEIVLVSPSVVVTKGSRHADFGDTRQRSLVRNELV